MQRVVLCVMPTAGPHSHASELRRRTLLVRSQADAIGPLIASAWVEGMATELRYLRIRRLDDCSGLSE